MATKTFKIGLSNTDKQNMAQDVYERLLALTFPEYDTSTSYDVGDFVVYNDQLYKCIGATSGAWDSTKWQLATLNDLVSDIEDAVQFVNDKANVDGNYPTMTVGVADQLSPYDEESGDDQEEPFGFQATGTGNGTQPDFSTGSIALMKEKQGNSVVVNQHIPVISSGLSVQGVEGSVTYNNNKVTLTCSGSQTNILQMYKTIGNQDLPIVAGHKYLQCATIYSSKNLNVTLRVYNNLVGQSFALTAGVAKFCIYIEQASENTSYKEVGFASSQNNVLENGDVVWFENMSLIDLTQWFNGDIPSDLLSNPENFFRYYQGSLAYNAGELVNANGRYLKTIGRNQWDEEWETDGSWIWSKNKLKVVPNYDYYYKGPSSVTLTFYDINDNSVLSYSVSANSTFTVPSNACSMSFALAGSTYNHDITISLYYEDESGYDQYYPYEVLTNNDTGTEVLRKAGNVCDIKLPDGTIKRNVGVLDLSQATGSVVDNIGVFAFAITNAKGYSENALTDAGYTASNATVVPENQEDKTFVFYGNGTIVQFKDTSFANESFDTFKASLSGKKLFYELATPTEEQGTLFSENIVIDDFGSMDFEGTNGVPQGNLIFYPVDYKAFIDTLYNYTEGTPSNIALKSDLTTVDNKHNALYDIVNENLGGILRHQLADKANIDFNDTVWIDLGTLTWTYSTGLFIASVPSNAKVNTTDTQPSNVLCPLYKTVERDAAGDNDLTIAAKYEYYIKNSNYTDATAFKNAMKGVLLAYEKASE